MTAPEEPLRETIAPRRQAAARHYGAHQYFTRRAWNVVQAYIAHFSRPGDLVLDPFGGAGTTAIEALVLRRRAVHVDLSPFACFLARVAALAPVDLERLDRAFEAAIARAAEGSAAGPGAWYPRGVALPPNADVETVEELFTAGQLRDLATLLAAIDAVTGPSSDERLLLRYAFSATLYKCSRTFLSAAGRAASRGGSAIFSVYRYKVAGTPVELPVLDQFRMRYRRLVAAKADTNAAIGPFARERGALDVRCGSADDLSALGDASVDYIFTDPPYGGHISYLDLATMFNAWLGLEPPPRAAEREAIEGGALALGREHYLACLERAAREMRRVLRPGRWLSLVYAHRDLGLWEAVIERFSAAGFSFVNVVRQPVSVVWSMHKKKRPGSTLAGEVILNFRAGERPAAPAVRRIAAEARASILSIQPEIQAPRRLTVRTGGGRNLPPCRP